MRLFSNLAIKHKLTAISLLTSGVALLLACSAFIAYEQVSYRRDMARELEITAHIIGANSASSLSFADNDSATLTLSSLADQPRIVRACIYDKDGDVFASYRRDPRAASAWPPPRDDNFTLDSDSLDVFHVIHFTGDAIGTIYLESDLLEFHSRRWDYISIAGSVFLAAIFVTWLIAARLQRLISEPISQLAAVAGRVGAENTYAIRATKRGDDEIGRLIDGFNKMLSQIEARDAELHAARRDLETRVEERTRSLEDARREATMEKARFQFIFESLPVGVSLASQSPGDATSSFLINDAQLRIVGLTREQVMADRGLFNKLTHPDDHELQLPLRARLRSGEIDRYTLEKRYIRPDGEIVWVSFLTQRQTYPDGRSETLSVIVDITGLKRAQEQTAREQARLKFIFDSVPVGISLYSGTKENLKESFLINNAHLHICGVTREQADSDPDLFGRISHPEDYARQQPLNAELAAGRLPRFTIEKRYIRPDGRVVWVVFAAQRIDYPDGRVETLGTVVDITDLKLAQQEAAREQARFRFIFESAPVGISLFSRELDGGASALLINDAHLAICGVSREQAEASGGKIFRELTHPEDRAQQAPLDADLDAARISRFALEKRYLRPDGRVVWVALSKQRVVHPDGHVERLSTVVDITSLKRAQEEAAREQARFKFIFESLPVGVSWRFLGGPDSKLLVNQAHERITGVPAAVSDDEGIFQRATHPDDRARQQPFIERLNRGEIDRYVFEKRYRHSDGRIVWVVLMSRVSTDPATGKSQSVTTLVDITDLKLAQEEIARERARFKFIFDALPVGVAWMAGGRPESRIINPSFARITGVPAERSRDIALYREATHPDDRALQTALFDKLRSGATDQISFEKRYQRGDGSICWTAFSHRLVPDPRGGDTQELTTVIDITERKDAEAQLEAAHKQLIRTSHQAGMAEVATGVLHNVGNVLNSVNVSATLVADLVRRSKAPNVAKVCDLLNQHRDDLGRYLAEDAKGRMIPAYLATLAESLATEQKTIIGELDSLHKNIGHIKDIVAMQQSYAKTSGVTETVSVPDLVEDAIRMNAGSLARHDVEVSRDYEARPVITVDKNKVLQILVNLIRNAKYACDESGRTDKRVILRTRPHASGVDISVVDNGIGISPENLTRIFAHGFTTRKHGHGFGLHSGALAAKELGGSLVALSDGPGKGATFTLRLPFKPAE